MHRWISALEPARQAAYETRFQPQENQEAIPMKCLTLSGVCMSILTLTFAGCSETAVDVTTTDKTELVNSYCPIMGSPVDATDLEPSLVKDWNGKKVGFCCPPCLEEWDELSDTEKADRIAKPPQGHSDTVHDHNSAAETSSTSTAPEPTVVETPVSQ